MIARRLLSRVLITSSMGPAWKTGTAGSIAETFSRIRLMISEVARSERTKTDTSPTVTVSAGQPAYAVVEGPAVDAADPDRRCPTYTDLQVIPPGSTDSVTVPAKIDTCGLQVHPVNSAP